MGLLCYRLISFTDGMCIAQVHQESMAGLNLGLRVRNPELVQAGYRPVLSEACVPHR